MLLNNNILFIFSFKKWRQKILTRPLGANDVGANGLDTSVTDPAGQSGSG